MRENITERKRKVGVKVRANMDFNLLVHGLNALKDERLRDSMKDWVSHTMLPTIVEHNVSLNITEDEVIDCAGTGVGGYFQDDEPAVLSLALGARTWVETLIHEFAHLTQWKDNAECWLAGTLDDGSDAGSFVDYWYAGHVELNKEQLDRYFAALIWVEHDAEIRALKMINKHKIPIDVKIYAQRANAYLLGYHEFRRRRSWSVPGKAPYLFDSITQEMPTDLKTLDYYDMKIVTSKMKKLYDECFEE